MVRMARIVKLLTPAVAAAVLFFVVAYIHAAFRGHYALTAEPRFGWLLGLLALIWVSTYAAGVNETTIPLGSRLLRSAAAVVSAVVVISLLELASVEHTTIPWFDVGFSVLLLTPGLALAAALSDRSLVQRGQLERVIAVIGDEERERLLRDAGRAPEQVSQVVALVAPEDVLPSDTSDSPLLDLIREHRATLVVLNREAQSLDDVVSQAARAHSRGVRIRTLSLFYDEWLGKLPISELERIALLFDINEIHRPVYARLKRLFDVVLASFGLVLLALWIPAVWLLDQFGNRGSLFYSQPRVGKDGAQFTIHKFRTMRDSDDAPTHWTSNDDPRIGRVGRMLRQLHVDELPQVWNVLRRELSIVGPRPEQPHYVAQLTERIPFYEIRHLVRPGITGWAQVKYDYGSTELDALEKLQYEFFYLRHQSLALDMRIVGRTLRSIAGREGR
jgi:lipopolysaccharide/colanic/teichoic acid biosynthesis glycosyltransferase